MIKKNQQSDIQTALEQIPTYRKEASLLLLWLAKKQSAITWDDNLQLYIYNTPIPGGNIAKLVHNAVKRKEGTLKTKSSFPNVPGTLAFYQILNKNNVPHTLINSETSKLLLKN